MTANIPENARIKRFTPVQRLFHLGLMLTFLIQGATGLGRMYIETNWGKYIAWCFGGYETSLVVHKVVGFIMLAGFAVQGLYILSKVDFKRLPWCLLDPDSIIPGPRDGINALKHVLWMLGLAKAPNFDRWGYWEKMDYWAVSWGMVVMGVTGIMMTFHMLTSWLLPGWALNIVFWIHRIEALLAMGHVFMIHFFIAHIRRHAFPMDTAMFEGTVDLEATRHEKPAWVARLESSGKLEEMLVPPASTRRYILFLVGGYAAVSVGLFLLIGGLVNAGSITW